MASQLARQLVPRGRALGVYPILHTKTCHTEAPLKIQLLF